jgi:hypothetical protein
VTGRRRALRPLIRAGNPLSSGGLLLSALQGGLRRIPFGAGRSGIADPSGRGSLEGDSAGNDPPLTFEAANIETALASAHPKRAAWEGVR